jgi:hypothetical protein
MTRAVLRNGVIQPVDPLPTEWAEGDELVVAKAPMTKESIEAMEKSFEEWEAACSDSTDEEEAILQAALDAQRRASKEYVRRQMGLSK